MQNGAPDLSTVSGPQLHVSAVLEGLRRRGHRTRTVAIQGQRTVWSDDLRSWHVPAHPLRDSRWFRLAESPVSRVQSELGLPYLGLFDSLRFGDACRCMLRGIDIIYERHGYMGWGGLVAARRLRVPHVLELNGNILCEIEEMRVPMSRLQREAGRRVTLKTFAATDHVVVVSAALKRILIEEWGIQGAKVSVLLNGVDTGLFFRTFDRRESAKRFGIPAGPVVMFVGSFMPWHGVDLLVTAFHSVQRRVPDAHLVLVGDGEGRERVEQQVRTLTLEPHVWFLGQLPQAEVAAALSLADVVAAPYPLVHDQIVGTPLKLIEYMAAGKAIVASTAPLHECLRHGVTGIRVPPADPEALANGILGLLESPPLRATLASNAREEARLYSWDSVVERLCAIFATLADART